VSCLAGGSGRPTLVGTGGSARSAPQCGIKGTASSMANSIIGRDMAVDLGTANTLV
jgi:hypothetical protein